MDTVLAPELIRQRKRKTGLTVLLVVLVLLAAVWMLRRSLKSSISRSEITTARVETGGIENTVNATGEVLPEFEEILTSPINASITSVLFDAGNSVHAGQSILLLDKSASQSDYDKLKFQLESRQNEIAKLKLDLDKSFYDIRSSNDIKQLRMASLADAVENARRLFTAGGGTREGIDQAELNLKVAQLEKKQLENEIKSKQQTMQIEIREAEISAAIQKKDLNELERKLRLANIVATRAGVITFVNRNIGANIREGETLARIADLSSFKIAGSISDNSLDALRPNMPVIVRINTEQLRGTVANISPSVQNGIVSFDIRLSEPHRAQLRPNMKVDVFLVTDSRPRTLRVANGPAFKGPSVQDIFVVRKGKAFRKTVHIGLVNFDFVELLDGVKAGDSIITSDMSEYKNATEILLKK